MKYYIHSINAGIAGVIILTAAYWSVLYFTTSDAYHPLQQFLDFKYWLIPLLAGFGIQTGLFWFLRLQNKSTGAISKSAIATGAGTSTIAMVACCAHHLVDFLPLLGFSAAALFLTQYQTYFFLLGIVSNIGGILFMSYRIRKHRHIISKAT